LKDLKAQNPSFILVLEILGCLFLQFPLEFVPYYMTAMTAEKFDKKSDRPITGLDQSNIEVFFV